MTHVPKTHYFVFDDIAPTDKMAEKKIVFWQKMSVKKFAYIEKKQYLCSVIKR